MANPSLKLHGFIGSALIGTSPFDPRSWSGISRFLFQEMQRQELLQGASGGEVEGLMRWLLLAASFHPQREVWRLRYYLSRSYRQALTRVLSPAVNRLPEGVDVLQLGGLFDLPSILQGRRRCFSYHDGNMAMRLKNPYAATAVPLGLAAGAMAYEKRLYHNLDRIFTMSEHLRSSFIEDFGVDPARVVCVGAGVNLETLPLARPEKRYDTKQVLFIGVEFVRKGGMILLEAFAKVRQTCPEAVLHVVGPKSPPPVGAPMDGVSWHGNLNKQKPEDAAKLEHLFEASSAFVLPSLYEPFGIAPAEAMMHSLPAVVSGEWALAETVVDGQTGLHVRPGEVDSLADALHRLLGDANWCGDLGRKARTHALQSYTWERVVRTMAAAMES